MLRTSTEPPLAGLVDSGDSLLPRALAHLREAIRLDPQNPYRRRNLAFFALAHERGEARAQTAAAAFSEALTIEPNLLKEVVDRLEIDRAPRDLLFASIPRRDDLRLALARYLEQRNRRDVAAIAFEDALAIASDPERQVSVRLAYSGFLACGGEHRRALEEARRALVLAPRSPEVFGALADAYAGVRDWRETASSLTTAVSLLRESGPDQTREYRHRLARAYAAQGQWDQAVAVRRQMVRDAPGDAEGRVGLALLLEEHGEWGEASREYQAAAELAPRMSSIHASAGDAYARHGLFSDAVSAYQTALRLSPDRADVRSRLAAVYERLGAGDRAAEEYRRVLAQRTDDPSARARLNALSARPAGP